MGGRRFTAGDVVALTGVPQSTLDHWCRAGVVRAAGTGRGTGHHRAFDLLTVVALAYANRWRAVGWGGPVPERVAAFVTGLGLDGVDRAVAAGRTFLLPPGIAAGGGRLIPPPVDPESGEVLALARRLDLGACVRDVRAKVRELSAHPANRTGRNRGLARRA